MDYSNIQERTQWTLNILPPLILKFFKTNIALAQWQSSKFKVILRQNTASSDCITGVSFWKGNNRFLFSINWFGYQLLENRKKVGLFSRNRLILYRYVILKCFLKDLLFTHIFKILILVVLSPKLIHLRQHHSFLSPKKIPKCIWDH